MSDLNGLYCHTTGHRFGARANGYNYLIPSVSFNKAKAVGIVMPVWLKVAPNNMVVWDD